MDLATQKAGAIHIFFVLPTAVCKSQSIEHDVGDTIKKVLAVWLCRSAVAEA